MPVGPVIPILAATATTVVGAGAFYGMFMYPRTPVWGRIYWRGRRGESRVALTFDDGPTAGSTAAILDALGELNVKAAFFVVGRNVERCPDLLRRMDAEGHLVANHTYDHHHFGAFHNFGYWNDQLDRTNDAIERVIGKRPGFFRPPMGILTLPNVRAARQRGMQVATWNRRAMDGVRTTAERILERLVPATRAGDVLLLHDGVPPHFQRDPSATVAVVRPLVLALRQRGLEMGRLDEVLGVEGYAGARV